MGNNNHSTGKKHFKQLSERERYTIEALLKAKHAPKEIAFQLGRDRRTIEREIKRGNVIQRNTHWCDGLMYLADAGQRNAELNASNKGRGLKIGHDHKLAHYLEYRIGKCGLSPDAAIGEIRSKGMEFTVTLCAKTVYNMIDRGDFLLISNKDLPIKRMRKKRKYCKTRTVALQNIRGLSIEERPQAVNEREEEGHWEMDLVMGKGKACLLCMTERKYRKELLFKLPNKEQKQIKSVLDSLERKHGRRFKDIFKSITTDNGSEFLDSDAMEYSCLKKGEKRTKCYYAHPYSAWERGSNENANKLIRRFIPKRSDISKITKREVKRIEDWINNYPRRMFEYKSANEMAAIV